MEVSTPPQLSLQNYFELPAWVRAMVSNDINMFHVALLQTPVKLAATLAAKLELDPKLQPLIDWCVAWLRAEQAGGKETEPKFAHLIRAYEEAKNQTPDEPAFQGRGAESLPNNCGVTMRMLQEYADGLPTTASTGAAFHPPVADDVSAGRRLGVAAGANGKR